MNRFAVVTSISMLCISALGDAGCRVYDAQLVQRGAKAGEVIAGNVSVAVVADQVDAATAVPPQRGLPGCGNGRLDDVERCDVAIAQGEPGACPDGCGARDGCFSERLEGTRCGARCVVKEITQAIPDDGCCPSGATPESDSDCSGTCGNAQLEGSETCDPPDRCLAQAACKTELACMSALYTGSPGTCSARCELVPIINCTSGDACCPTGCTEQDDADCALRDRRQRPGAATSSTAPRLGAAGAAGTAGAAGAGPQVEPSAPAPAPGCTEDSCDAEPGERCAKVHAAGGPCQACDCAYCSDQFLKCEDQGSERTRSACLDLIQCATRNHCSGVDCYCGSANLTLCAGGWANGPCMWEVRAVAGSNDAVNIFLQAFAGQGPLLYAANALSCRGQHCQRACGL